MTEGADETKQAEPLGPEQAEEVSDATQSALFPGAPTVANLNEADVLASLSAWARAFGTDRETLRRVLLEREVQPVAERAGHKLYAARHVYRAWSDGTDETDPDKLSPFKRRAWYQGEREKMALQIERGELVAEIEMQRVVGQLSQLYVRGLETLQDRIERAAGLTPDQAKALDDEVFRIREELCAELEAESAEEGEPEAGASTEAPVPAVPPPKPRPRTDAPTGGSAVDDAIGYLRRALETGAQPTADLIEAGKKFGLSEATLRRAKAQMGAEVRARRQGRGWVWELVQDD